MNDDHPRQLIENAELILFDSDGVLVEEGDPLPGAIDLVEQLINQGKKVVVLSNNSTKHPNTMKEQYQRKGLKITTIINSGITTARYCRDHAINRVFVVGEWGLIDLLQENQIHVTDSHPDAVIVGMDRDLTYEKLAVATRLIRSGATFIATNPDRSFPTSRGLEPGAGSMIAAIAASSDIEPEVIIGKPNEFGYQLALKQFELDPEQCVMIGDRYETDILGALKAGIPAFVVNTGIASSREYPGRWQDNPEVPVVQSLTDLLE